MQMTRIDGLSFAMDGDYINLEQDCGLGEVDRVRLHRIHLAHLAQLTGLTAHSYRDELTAERMGDALLDLRNRIADLANMLESVPIFPPGRETEDVTAACRLLRLADRYLDRFEIAEAASSASVQPCALPVGWPLSQEAAPT